MDPQKVRWLAIALCLIAGPSLAQQQGLTTVVSAGTSTLPPDGASKSPSVSADGRLVAFASDATDLVAGDTNANTDVFVRDAHTGVTERVSITWKGQEPRGDSSCPVISADGRYVAFRSQAWNMYSGGANLGSPRWDVYVRDRHLGTTERLTVGHDGSEPDGEADCPSISDDGNVVAFSSDATNLVSDYPLPFGESAIDRASFAFVWERAPDAIRLLTVLGENGPTSGSGLALSGDGSTIAFAGTDLLQYSPRYLYVLRVSDGELLESHWWRFGPAALSTSGRYLVSSAPILWSSVGDARLYWRDRELDQEVWINHDRFRGPCPQVSPRGYCRRGRVGAPTISGDGRFVGFSSSSQRLLAAQNGGDQIFVWDAISHRIRRISVTPNRWSGAHCSVEPSISRDGQVIAYRSGSDDIVGNPSPDRHEVFRSEWQCPGGQCTPRASCAATPTVCLPADRSSVRFRQAPPAADGRSRFAWKWVGPPLSGQYMFPNPADGAQYDVCVYAGGQIALDAALPAGVSSSETPTGFRIRDASAGLSSLSLKHLDNRSIILARGRGPALDAPYLPLSGYSLGISVELHERATGRCWGTTFQPSAIQRNTAGEVTEDGRTHHGRFYARR